MNNGVDRESALKIWQKVNGQYMFPEISLPRIRR